MRSLLQPRRILCRVLRKAPVWCKSTKTSRRKWKDIQRCWMKNLTEARAWQKAVVSDKHIFDLKCILAWTIECQVASFLIPREANAQAVLVSSCCHTKLPCCHVPTHSRRNSHSCGPNSETRRTTCPCNASEQGAMKLRHCHYWESVPETRLKRQSSRAWVMTMDHLDRASEMSTASLASTSKLHIMNLDWGAQKWSQSTKYQHHISDVFPGWLLIVVRSQPRHTMVEYSWGRKSTPASKSFASSNPKESMRKKTRKKWLEVQTAMKAACRIKASSNGENGWKWWKWKISDQWSNEYEEWQSDMWWQVVCCFRVW